MYIRNLFYIKIKMESQNRNDETVKVIDLTTSEKKLNELDNKLKHIGET